MNTTRATAPARDELGPTDLAAVTDTRRLMTAVTRARPADTTPATAAPATHLGTAAMPPTGQQRLSALARANDVRRAISEIRGEINRGELDVADALRDPRAQRMIVYDVLRARRRYGPRIARKILDQLQISERRRVGELTDRQRTAIAQRLAVTHVTRSAWDAD